MTEDTRPFKPDCELWRGFRPCPVQRAGGRNSCAGCDEYAPLPPAPESFSGIRYDPRLLRVAGRVCIVEAGGLGSVLRTTAVSRAVRRLNPDAELLWITHGRGVRLLRLVPGVRPLDARLDVAVRRAVAAADVVVNFDTADLGRTVVPLARTVAGFTLTGHGRFAPAPHADPLQRLQIDDRLRRRSRSPLQRVLVGVLGLGPVPAGYDLALPTTVRTAGAEEVARCLGGHRPSTVIGLNVGSSRRGRLKRWPPQRWAELAVRLVQGRPDRGVVLLAGPEDRIARAAVSAGTDRLALPDADRARIGMPAERDVAGFLGLVAGLDLVVTADTFALHAAAALDVPLVVVVGPMPHHELELGPLDQVAGPALDCAPCFLRCGQPVSGACMLALEVPPVLARVEHHLTRTRSAA